MSRHLFIGVLLLMFAAACVPPAIAEGQQVDRSPAASATRPTTDSDRAEKQDEKKKDRCDQGRKDKDLRENARLEYEARGEAERRKRVERRHGLGPVGTVVVIESPDGLGSTGRSAAGPAYSYGVEERRAESSAGIAFAPGQRGKDAAYGVFWLGPNKIGAMAWFSGNLKRDDDVIDTMIPHDDYWLEASKGSYALQGIVGLGSRDAMVVLGAGLAVKKTLYTAVSNVTGWRWNAGSDSAVKLAGQAGLRFRIADRFSLHFGYDTSQFAFFGLAGSF